MIANNMKIQNINNVLNGTFDSTYNKKGMKPLVKTDTVNLFSISPEDEALRKEMADMQGTSLKYSDKKTKNINADESIYNLYFFPPVKGMITSKYDAKQGHYGIDVAAPSDEPVKTCLDGTVISSNWTLDGGYELTIQHAYNLVSIYKHNSKILKKTGNFVKAGEAISIIGNSGEKSTGPHLHFEIWKNGVAMDPATFIKF